MKKFMYTRIICILIIIISGCGIIACIGFFSQERNMDSDYNLHNEYFIPVSYIDTWFGDIGVTKQKYDNKEAIVFFYNNMDSFLALQDAIFANMTPLYITNYDGDFVIHNSADKMLNFDKISGYMDLLQIKSISYSVESINKEIAAGNQRSALYLTFKLQNEADESLVYSETASIREEEYVGWWELGGNWFYPDEPQHIGIGPDCYVP